MDREIKIPYSKLAIIITALNAADTIKDTLISIMEANSDLDSTILVFDDGSDKDLTSYLREWFHNPNLFFFRSNTNLGRGIALNKAIEMTRSEYIAIVDADDLVTRIRFLEPIMVLDSNPNIDCVSGQFKRFGRWGYSDRISNYPTDYSEILKAIQNNRNIIGHSGVTFRRDWFNRVGGYRQFPRCQDLDLFLRGFDHNYYISKNLYFFYRTSARSTKLRYFIDEELWRKTVIKHQKSVQLNIEGISQMRRFDLQLSLGVKYFLLRFLMRI